MEQSEKEQALQLANRIVENNGLFDEKNKETCAPATCVRLARYVLGLLQETGSALPPPAVIPFDSAASELLFARVHYVETADGKTQVANKIALIKDIREKYHCGLAEAKEFVETTLE